jgi:hypothetical protein
LSFLKQQTAETLPFYKEVNKMRQKVNQVIEKAISLYNMGIDCSIGYAGHVDQLTVRIWEGRKTTENKGGKLIVNKPTIDVIVHLSIDEKEAMKKLILLEKHIDYLIKKEKALKGVFESDTQGLLK